MTEIDPTHIIKDGNVLYYRGEKYKKVEEPQQNDMPWVNFTQEEVEELRNKKHTLTEYGKEKLRKLIYEQDVKKINDAAKNLVLENLTHEEMLDEAERREKSNRVLERYNDCYNMECASLPHGTPITPEHQQMITLQCMIDALESKSDVIAIIDIEDLIARLDEQATEFLERVRKNNETL